MLHPITIIRQRKRALILFTLTVLFFIFIDALISRVALSSFSNLEIKLEVEHEDRLTVYYRSGHRAHFSDKRTVFSEPEPTGKPTQASINLRDRIARNIRLDPGDTRGRVKIYGMRLTGHFGPPLQLDAEDIHERFIPNQAIENFTLHSDHVQFDIHGADPQLVLKDELVMQNRFMSLVLPLVFSLAFYLAISHFGRSSFPAFYDLSHHKSSANLNYAGLDGVRGIAVLLVLLDHSWGLFTGAGTAGVWIFFVLSGFLLAIPFTKKPEIAVSYDYMSEYLLRRLKRILPMYYFFIVLSFFFFGKFESEAFRHLLFLQGDGHLWTIPQEMLFYLFLPFIMIINYLLFRGNSVWIIAALIIMMLLANEYLDKSVLTMYGEGETRPAFAGIFICGILFSYIYHGIIAKNNIPQLQQAFVKHSLSITGIALLILFVLLSTDTLLAPKPLYAFRHFGWFGFAAGLIILLVLITPGSLYDKLLSWLPLRALGLVGFSFYLLHPHIISLVKGMQDYYLGYRVGVIPQLLLVLVITYLVSAFTYSYIERPFLKLAKKQAN